MRHLTARPQTPLIIAAILMEMTRDPGIVGSLMQAALLARRTSGVVMPLSLYHVLAESWRLAPKADGSRPS